MAASLSSAVALVLENVRGGVHFSDSRDDFTVRVALIVAESGYQLRLYHALNWHTDNMEVAIYLDSTMYRASKNQLAD